MQSDRLLTLQWLSGFCLHCMFVSHLFTLACFAVMMLNYCYGVVHQASPPTPTPSPPTSLSRFIPGLWPFFTFSSPLSSSRSLFSIIMDNLTHTSTSSHGSSILFFLCLRLSLYICLVHFILSLSIFFCGFQPLVLSLAPVFLVRWCRLGLGLYDCSSEAISLFGFMKMLIAINLI